MLAEGATNKKNKDIMHQVIRQMVDIHTTLKIHIQYCADFKEEIGGEGREQTIGEELQGSVSAQCQSSEYLPVGLPIFHLQRS